MGRGNSFGSAIGDAISAGWRGHQDDQQRRREEALEARRQQMQDRYREIELQLRERGILREEERYEQGRRDDAARVAAGSLLPGDEVGDATAETLSGTPYESLTGSRKTLPSRSNPLVSIDPWESQAAPLEAGARPEGWNDDEEARFRGWYGDAAGANQLDPDPDAPEQRYNYRHAFRSGASADGDGHWPSEFKAGDHPNRFVDGVDTVTGRGVSRGVDIRDAGGQPHGRVFNGTAEQRREVQERERAQALEAQEESDLETELGLIPDEQTRQALRLQRRHKLTVDPAKLRSREQVAADQRAEDLRKLGIREAEERIDAKYREPRQPPVSEREDPELPIAVERVLGDLRRRGLKRAEAEDELARQWSALAAQHPRLSDLKVAAAIDRLWPVNADGDEIRPRAGGAGRAGASGRGRGAGPRGDGLSDIGLEPANQPQPRTATMAEVQAVAKKLGRSEAEIRRDLEARGVVIR